MLKTIERSYPKGSTRFALVLYKLNRHKTIVNCVHDFAKSVDELRAWVLEHDSFHEVYLPPHTFHVPGGLEVPPEHGCLEICAIGGASSCSHANSDHTF